MTVSSQPDTHAFLAVLASRSTEQAAVATCACGRTHFHPDSLPSDEQRQFLDRASHYDQRYFATAMPVTLVQVGDLRYVHHCPCDWHGRLARLLWQERDLFTAFLRHRAHGLRAIADEVDHHVTQLTTHPLARTA